MDQEEPLPTKTKSGDIKIEPDDGYFTVVAKYWWQHWSLSMANAMAWYEFAAFVSMEPWLSEKFFYGSDAFAWFAFGITFVAQSIGGLTIGTLADKFGRRPAMLATLSVMFFTTTGQGLTPDVPILGTIWLITCRIFQGLASGGELGSITVYMAETIPRQALSMSGLVVTTGISVGFVVSTLVGYLFVQTLTQDQMMSWGWRMPFLVAGIPVALSLYKSWSVEESGEFEAAHHDGEGDEVANVGESSSWDCIFKYWPQGMLCILGCASSFAQQYLAGAYLEDWLVNTAGLPDSQAFGILLAAQSFMAVASFPGAILGDMWGLGSANLFGSVAASLLSVPGFWMLYNYPHSQWAIWIGGIAIPSMLQGLSVSVNPWISEMFPTEVRCAAVSFYFNVGQAVGGFAPLICQVIPGALVPGWYSLVCGVISSIANAYCIHLHKQYMETGKGLRIVHLREEFY